MPQALYQENFIEVCVEDAINQFMEWVEIGVEGITIEFKYETKEPELGFWKSLQF